MRQLDNVWPLVLASVPLIAVLIAGTNAWLAARNERRRTQPVVITNEWRKRTFSDKAEAWTAAIYLTNESIGTAFNVRCGLLMKGFSFPFRGPSSEGRPRLWRVVPAGTRLPELSQGGDRGVMAFGLLLPTSEVSALEGDPDEDRIYWCRYENAHGETWETLNPADPTVRLKIRRVRLCGLRERRDARRLRQLRDRGARIEAAGVAELRAAMNEDSEADRHAQ